MSGIIIVGAGKMGLPIAWSLYKLGHAIYIVEPNDVISEQAQEFLRQNGISACFKRNISDFDHLKSIDAVISAAPYSANYHIAQNCLMHKRRYSDLGGNPSISTMITKMFAEHGIPCITDLGLAPGFANIIAEHGLKQIKDVLSSNIKIRVGGLPVSPNNTLKYNQVFSIDGLYNEYTGKCDILRFNKIVTVDTLTEVEEVDFLVQTTKTGKLEENYEAFQTKGGLGTSHALSNLFARGISSCDYKTIRYKNHLNYIKFMLNECKMDQESFTKAIQASCPITREDKVLISVSIEHNSGTWIRRDCIKHNEMWTAMQLTTAFPAASVTSILASGSMDKIGLNYSDIPTDLFFEKLEKIGGFKIDLLK